MSSTAVGGDNKPDEGTWGLAGWNFEERTRIFLLNTHRSPFGVAAARMTADVFRLGMACMMGIRTENRCLRLLSIDAMGTQYFLLRRMMVT